jgi:hypothetical protein
MVLTLGTKLGSMFFGVVWPMARFKRTLLLLYLTLRLSFNRFPGDAAL